MPHEMEKLAEEMKAKSEAEAQAKTRLEEEVEKWPEQVSGLIDILEEWLFPLKQFGLSTQTYMESKREHELQFEVPKLIITYNQKRATTDATLFCFGAKGRLDLKGPNGAEIVMVMREAENGHVEWQKFTKGNNPPHTSPLTQDHMVEFVRKAFKI